MNRSYRTVPTRPVLAVLALALLWVAVSLPRVSLPETRANPISQPTQAGVAPSDWRLISLAQGYTPSIISSPPASSTPLDSSGFPQPPGDYCRIISQLTGQPCRWQANRQLYDDGSQMVEIELRSGDQVLARAESLKISLRELIELDLSGEGWTCYIEVAKWLERAGFGRLMWQAVDLSLRQFNSLPITRVFIDSAGWVQALLGQAGIEFTRYGDKVYIYLIGE